MDGWVKNHRIEIDLYVEDTLHRYCDMQNEIDELIGSQFDKWTTEHLDYDSIRKSPKMDIKKNKDNYGHMIEKTVGTFAPPPPPPHYVLAYMGWKDKILQNVHNDPTLSITKNLKVRYICYTFRKIRSLYQSDIVDAWLLNFIWKTTFYQFLQKDIYKYL